MRNKNGIKWALPTPKPKPLSLTGIDYSGIFKEECDIYAIQWLEYFKEKASEDKRTFLQFLEDEIKIKSQNPGETHSGEAEKFFGP